MPEPEPVAAEVPEPVVPEPEPVAAEEPGPVVPEPEPVAAEVADLTEPVAAEVAAVTAEVTGAAAEVADEVAGRPEPELEAAGPAADTVGAEVAASACRENTSRMVRIPAAKIATCTAR